MDFSVSAPRSYYFFTVMSFRPGSEKYYPTQRDGVPAVISSAVVRMAFAVLLRAFSLVLC